MASLFWMRRALLLSALAALVAAVSVPASAGETPGLAETRAAAQQAAQDLADAEAALGELHQELQQLEAERDQAAGELAALQEEVAELAVSQYVTAGGALEVIEPDPNRQAVAEALAQVVTRADSDAIDQYRAARSRLDAATAEIEARLAEQEAVVGQLADAQQRLEAELARLEEAERRRIEEERRRAEEEARRAEQTAEREAAARRADQLARQQEAQAAGDAAASGGVPDTPEGPVVANTDGGMVCPVPGSTFIDSFGAPRPQGWAHKGVDMMAPSGTPVLAPVSGTVEHRSNPVGGLAFHLDGSDGRYYYGAHLSAYGNGGSVAAGTVIGYVGNTGDAAATAPHLHLEIHIGGVAVNPYPYVAAVC